MSVTGQVCPRGKILLKLKKCIFSHCNHPWHLTFVKNEFGYEKYLDLSKYKSYRQHITKIRLSSHKLRIETGRYGRNRIDRNERLCQICNCGDIEDEYHFIIICSKYSDIRKKYIAKYYLQRPSMYKFLELLSNKNHKILDNLAIFIKHALQIRNVHLTIMS